MEALHDVVRSGKARYIGASSMFAWQFAKAQATAEQNGWTRFVSMQNHYNLLYREEEREMIPQCVDQGVGDHPVEPARPRTARREPDGARREADDARADRPVRRLALHAGRRLRSRRSGRRGRRGPRRAGAQVALAWLLHKPGVTAPIVGATKIEPPRGRARGRELELERGEVARLEEPYVTHAVSGHA